jgi:hypothetical protein
MGRKNTPPMKTNAVKVSLRLQHAQNAEQELDPVPGVMLGYTHCLHSVIPGSAV